MSAGRSLKLGHEQAFLFVSDEYDGVSTRSRAGELWALRVRLKVPGIEASALVHLSVEELQLPPFFAGLADDWRGWAGAREWGAHEGGLALSCTHDGRGTVSMGTELRDPNLGWVVRAVVPLDAGQLEQLARETAEFFG